MPEADPLDDFLVGHEPIPSDASLAIGTPFWGAAVAEKCIAQSMGPIRIKRRPSRFLCVAMDRVLSASAARRICCRN